MVEYASILAVIALAVLFGLGTLGTSVADVLGDGECQGGGDWSKQHVWAVNGGDKKTAMEEDAKGDGDGVVCVKNPTGGGGGNQGNSANVMDN